MKFHEDIFNCFKVIEWTRFCHRNYYLQSSHRAVTKKMCVQELWFLYSARWPMLINIYMKTHENIWDVLKYRDQTCFSCVNICRVPRKLFEYEASSRIFKRLPRHPANVNALKLTCLIVIFAFYMIP